MSVATADMDLHPIVTSLLLTTTMLKNHNITNHKHIFFILSMKRNAQ